MAFSLSLFAQGLGTISGTVLEDGSEARVPRQVHDSPGNEAMRDVPSRVRVVVRAKRSGWKITEISSERIQVTQCLTPHVGEQQLLAALPR